MTEHPPESHPEEPGTDPALTEEQQAYEQLFGTQAEWHTAPTPEDPEELDDDALYRALFGA